MRIKKYQTGSKEDPYELPEIVHILNKKDKEAQKANSLMFPDKSFRRNINDLLYLDEETGADRGTTSYTRNQIHNPNLVLRNLYFLYNKSTRPTHFSDSSHGNGRSYYSSSKNFIYNPTDTNSTDSDTTIENYLAELAHALLYGDTKELQGSNKGGQYVTPGSLERIAHGNLANKLWNFIHYDFEKNEQPDMIADLRRLMMYDEIVNSIKKEIDFEKKSGNGKMTSEQHNKIQRLSFKKGGLLPRKFQYGGILPEFTYEPTFSIEPNFRFGPNVYVGRKGTQRYSEEDNHKALWKKGKPLYDEFIKAGVNPYVAVALMGNIGLESSFDPNARNGEHLGYVQNQRSFLDYIKKYYGGYGHTHQMLFLIDGLTRTIRGDVTSGTGKELHNRFTRFNQMAKRLGKNIPALTYAWENAYEKSGGQGNPKRRKLAEAIFKYVGLR